MHKGFWDTLDLPIMALAPMADVTDAAFRRIIAKYGKPDVSFTEFVPADGLCSPGRDHLIHDLWYDESERPIVAQLVGGNPNTMREAAKLIQELGFDGLDINMGCPAKEMGKSKSGAFLIQNPDLAVELIQAAKEGAPNLPVSVKTRTGFTQPEIETWIPKLIEASPVAITLHARTRKEMSKVPAQWDLVARAVEIARELRPNSADRPLILGNGDVETLAEARQKVDKTGADGVMIGRGIFGNPWLFSTGLDNSVIPVEEKLRVLLEHTALYIELLSDKKPLEMMKRHFKAYCSGFPGAVELRIKLMAAENYKELEALVKEFLND